MHTNVRLTQKGWQRLVSQVLVDHRPLAELAAWAGISLRCAYEWLARYFSNGASALVDRRSLRRTQLRHIARLFAAPFSTLARVLNCLGLGRLRNLEAKPKVQCYEREMAGEPTHNAV